WHRVRSSNVLLVASMFPTWVSCCTFLLRLGGLWLLPSLPTRRSSDLHKLLYPFVCIGPFDGSADEFPYPVDQNPSDRKKDQRKDHTDSEFNDLWQIFIQEIDSKVCLCLNFLLNIFGYPLCYIFCQKCVIHGGCFPSCVSFRARKAARLPRLPPDALCEYNSSGLQF